MKAFAAQYIEMKKKKNGISTMTATTTEPSPVLLAESGRLIV